MDHFNQLQSEMFLPFSVAEGMVDWFGAPEILVIKFVKTLN